MRGIFLQLNRKLIPWVYSQHKKVVDSSFANRKKNIAFPPCKSMNVTLISWTRYLTRWKTYHESQETVYRYNLHLWSYFRELLELFELFFYTWTINIIKNTWKFHKKRKNSLQNKINRNFFALKLKVFTCK